MNVITPKLTGRMSFSLHHCLTCYLLIGAFWPNFTFG